MEETIPNLSVCGLAFVLSGGLFAINRGLGAFCKGLCDDPEIARRYQKQLGYLNIARRVLSIFSILFLLGGLLVTIMAIRAHQQRLKTERAAAWPAFDPSRVWTAPNPLLADTDHDEQLIAYGRDLIAHTQDYFGPEGLVRPGSINQLNCQSCHLEAGAKPYGNNYFAVFSTYPQMRARSGSLETIPKRVNDCFMRSLNGQAIDTTSREMKAILAYIKWLGTGVPKGIRPKGSGIMDLPYLQRAADAQRGELVYNARCASCHGADGQGLPIPPDNARSYPPLWGEGSYNESAGLFRLSRFAGYVKANMPFGATYLNPTLSDEEAWDVAAFVNSKPRPGHPFLSTDWPDIGKKPVDHPFGPYKDTFPDIQHKFGPFGPIAAFYKK